MACLSTVSIACATEGFCNRITIVVIAFNFLFKPKIAIDNTITTIIVLISIIDCQLETDNEDELISKLFVCKPCQILCDNDC